MNEQKEKTANQIIHEWLGHCWHEYRAGGYPKCRKCSKRIEFLPAYDLEPSPRYLLSEVEAKVIETFGADAYLTKLITLGGFADDEGLVGITIATAPASVRVKAIVSLIEEKENGR